MAALKSLRNYNDANDRILYLNNEKINNNEVMFWEDNCNIDLFLKEKEKYLNKNNVITIEFLKPSNFEYFNHLLIYSCENVDDEINFFKEAKRWKDLSTYK